MKIDFDEINFEKIELEDFLTEVEAEKIIRREKKQIISTIKCSSQASTSQATEADTTGFCSCCV